MLTEQQSQFILGEVSEPVIAAAKEIHFNARYDALLAQFPKRPGDFNPKVQLMQQQALVAQFPHPIRFYKGEGGYYMLNEKKFTHPHMNLMIEMRQWVVFRFNLWRADKRIGGGDYQAIAVAERLSRGEAVVWDDWDVLRQPWCYDETQLHTVLSECFALFDDLCKQLPD